MMLVSSPGILSAMLAAIGVVVKIYTVVFLIRSELLLSYFCDNGLGCSDPKSLNSLQKAKAAVEQQYSMVGVSESRKVSLAVMEAHTYPCGSDTPPAWRRRRGPSGRW